MTVWPVMTLGEAGVSLIDCVHKTPKAQAKGYPYVGIPQMKSGHIAFEDARLISPEDYEEWTKKAKPQSDDVILSRRTNPGVIAVDKTNTPFALGQNLVLLRSDGTKVYPPFLRWLCLSRQWWDQIEKFINVGAVFSSLRCADVPKFELPVPPMRDQEEIAGLLGALDDKIELNRRMSATLEEMARALYRSWFVEFEPVHARALGQSPAHMDPTTAALFPDRFGPDGLPKGWEDAEIGQELLILDSKRVPLSKQQRQGRTGKIPYYGATSVMDYVDEHIFDEILLLVGEDGSVAKPDGKPFTQYIWGKAWVNNHAHVLKGKNFSVEQLKCFFETISVAEFITGAVQMKLSQGNMKKIPWVRAPDDIHLAFDTAIEPWHARVRLLADEAANLATLRDALLPRLMSGELRVREAEKQVEELV